MRFTEFIMALSVATLLYLDGCKSERSMQNEAFVRDSIFINVHADIESDPVPGNINDDAADDPAIWYNESSPSKSLVFGTDKKGGIIVFNLNGKILKYHKIGLPNNIDIRQGFKLGYEIIDVAGFSNRMENTIEIFKIMPDGDLINTLEHKLKPKFSGEVYGFCFYYDKNDKLYAIINSKNGDIEQWFINGSTGKIIPAFIQSFKTETQPEGMVADDELDVLFVGEEDKGIWKFDLSNNIKQNPFLIESSSVVLNSSLKDDIEGLTIYYSSNGGGYLIASSQGNNSYAVFTRSGVNDYIGSFCISEGNFDGTEDTDGIDIFNLPLNNTFPSGLFIAQDGTNSTGVSDTLPQNFKFVNWSKIARSFNPELNVDTLYIVGTKK